MKCLVALLELAMDVIGDPPEPVGALFVAALDVVGVVADVDVEEDIATEVVPVEGGEEFLLELTCNGSVEGNVIEFAQMCATIKRIGRKMEV